MILGVTGKPISHSLSPLLHRAAMHALGMNGASLRLIADSAEEALTLSKQLGLRGLNVTAPFKQEIFSKLAGCLGADAVRTGAVNTIIFEFTANSHLPLHGENTDVGGVRECLQQVLVNRGPSGIKALVLGAGGAARAAVCALGDLGIDILVANRTLLHAQKLTAQLGGQAIEWLQGKLTSAFKEVQIIISTIPESALLELIPLMQPGQVLLNAVYAEAGATTAALQKQGIQLVDGREWLLHQGRLALRHFLDEDVSLEILRAALPEKLSSHRSISLIGMMGSGKSTVGVELAALSSLPFVDADIELERRTAESIAEIFAQQGEGVFRRLEQEVIASLCSGEELIIACGGGVVLNSENIKRLREKTQIVWLWSEPEVLSQRVNGGVIRPLLRSASSPTTLSTSPVERMRQILDSRLALYADAADLVIDTTHRSPKEVAARIHYEIH